ncbi:annexin D5-like [Arachis hypogaea]|uniref:annexin D5-like n=1 Tax=Arachis hypogaea TaxID=3818 RepID=UPI003B22234B
MSTLTTPPNGCSPRDDAAQLHKALKGLRSDTAKIVNILAHRDSEQRDLIQQAYETSFSEPLYKRISTDLHGHVKRALKLWLHDALTRDAIIIRKALTSSPVVDYQAVNEIICSRTPSQIRRFKDAYLSTYHSNLDEDLDKQLSGDHKKLLVAYITIQRYEGPELDEALVQQDAQQLYKSADKKIGTDEKTLIRIFSERSSTHLAAVSSAYKASFGTPLEKFLNFLIDSTTETTAEI